MRIGIFGGTFNPPHLGHLVCAQEAYVQLALNRVMMIPVRIPPHKPVDEEPGAEHRLELVRRAITEDAQRLEVSDLEVRRPGPSYTVDTLEELHCRVPDSELFLIVGGDVAAGLPSWREPQRVLSLASLAVAERPGTPRAVVDDALRRVGGAGEVTFFNMPEIGVSSTMVRERVRDGVPIKYLVPEPVAGYIRERDLYGNSREQ